MKKLFLLLSLCFFVFTGFAYEKDDLYGSWIIDSEAPKVAKKASPVVPIAGIKSVLQATMIIVPEGEANYVRLAGYGPINITNFMRVSDEEFFIRVKYNQTNQKKAKEPAVTVLNVKFLDEDTIKFTVSDSDSFYPQFPKGEVIMYRFFTPKRDGAYKAKTSIGGQLYRKPTGDSENWGLVPGGTNVLVKEEKNGWSKVEIDNYPDGWLPSKIIEKN